MPDYDDDLFDDNPTNSALWNSEPIRTLRQALTDLADENARLHRAVRLLYAADEVSS